MLVVLPFYSGDAHRLVNLLEWLALMDRESLQHHSALLWCPFGTQVKEMNDLALKSFGASSWAGYDETGGAYPQPQNNAWQSAARYIATNEKLGPWLWLENDATPIRSGWLDILENAHKVGGKPFSGHAVGDQHMTGVGIYPNVIYGHIQNALLARSKPFDIVAGVLDGILPKVHRINNLIQHTPDVDHHFNSQADVDRIVHPEAVLFHKCKDGSLIDVLSKSVKQPIPPVISEVVRHKSEPVITRCDHPIIHVVERHKPLNPDESRRNGKAVESWIKLYDSGQAIPVHSWDSERVSKDLKLPYLKDVLLRGMNKAKSLDDIIMFTNSDTILHPYVCGHARLFISECFDSGATLSFRANFKSGALIPNEPRDIGASCEKDYGRDLFAFSKRWLRAHWWDIPDFLLGVPEWDVVMAILIRKTHYQISTLQNLKETLPLEMPRGWVIHEKHAPQWNGKPSEEKTYNLKLALEWYSKNNLNHLNTLGKVA